LTVEITQVNNCRKNLANEISAKEFEIELEKVAREYARNVKIPGFRPGKVPTNIIRRRMEKDICAEAAQRVIDRVWNEAIDANAIKPLTMPEITELENSPGNPLKFTLSFEELPPLEVKDYKGVEVRQDSVEIKDEDLARAIDGVREQYSQFVPVEGEAKDGHYVLANVDGLIEGESAPHHDEDITLIVGHPQTTAEFSEKLRGAKVDDTISFEVNYPDDYQNKHLAGKKTTYTVLVKDIKERQLPEINDDFAKDIGFDNADMFRARIQADLAKHTGMAAEKKAKEQLLDSIIERQPIDVPDCLVTEELGNYAQNMINSLAYEGLNVKEAAASFDWKKIYDEQRPHATRQVRRMIFLDAIARQENIEVSEDEISAELNKMAIQMHKSAEALKAEYEKANRTDAFKKNLLYGKTLDFIYHNAIIRVE